MKVLQINSVCGIRSTGRICTDIADILNAGDDDCKIGYGREKVPPKYEQISVRIGSHGDATNHAMMSRIFDNAGYGSKQATKRFLEYVDRYSPDVIHLHNLHGYYVHVGLLFDYLKKTKKNVVWTLHDCWAFTGHCAHFDYLGCQKWEKNGCYTCPQKREYPSSILLDRSRKNFIEKKQFFTGMDNMTIVTPSKWLANLAERSFLGCYPIKVINNGIDLSVFKPTVGDFRERYGLQNKIIFLGVATAWSKFKGLYDFIKMNEIKRDNEVLVLVGLTEQQISALPDGIIGISRTNNSRELAQIYSSADVFINPTYQETFGLTNIEAQACGTPAVTYRTGGSPEGVPAENVVARGDVQALLDKAREVAVSPKLLDVSAFSRDDCYAKYIDLYHGIADRL